MFVSSTAKSIVWLLRNDPDGWVQTNHAIAHSGAGIGLWVSNGVWFCNPRYNIPRDSARRGFILDGREVKLSILDKFYIWSNVRRAAIRDDVIPSKIAEFAEKKFDKAPALPPEY